jgi:O-antigen/teichoic acid export membrane protein
VSAHRSALPRRNLVAALGNSFATALIGLAVVPLYLRYLGVEAFGLLGFFTTTQAMVQILDLGLAPTMNREVARDPAAAAPLLFTLERIYWAVGLAIAGAIALAAPLLAEKWLRAEKLPVATVTSAIRLMGCVIAARWPAGLYLGVLMGAQRLTLASVIGTATVATASGGAVLVLAFVAPTVQAFFLWQAGVGLGYLLVTRFAAWRVLGGRRGLGFDAAALKRIWRFSAGLSGIALSALVLTQLDKVVLSRVLPLESFGRYTLATSIATALYTLVIPFFNAAYPRFCALVARHDEEQIIELYRNGTRLLGTLLFPAVLVLALFGTEVLTAWTHNPQLAGDVAPIVRFMVLGTALHGVMNFPYALQLAYGVTRLPLSINVVLVTVLVPLLLLLTRRFGPVGAAMAWFALHACYLVVGTVLTHRFLLRGLARRWLTTDVAIPLLAALAVLGAGARATAGLGVYPRLAAAAALGLASIAATLALSPRLRRALVARRLAEPAVQR